jgi:hypothetical protein
MPALVRFFICAFAIAIMASVMFAQSDSSRPSPPRPAPQISGRLIDTDGASRLTVAYEEDLNSRTFTGTIHSICVLPASSRSGSGRSLQLSEIPIGTAMTLFYVSRKSGNVILAMRLDRVSRPGSELPQGVSIPCFAPARQK